MVLMLVMMSGMLAGVVAAGPLGGAGAPDTAGVDPAVAKQFGQSGPGSIIVPELGLGAKQPEPAPSLTMQLIPTPGAVGLLGLGLAAMSRRKRPR
jgi:MYXO-CTERM domain-containing protein